MKFTVAAQMDWGQLSPALHTWIEDKDYELNERHIPRLGSKAYRNLGVDVIAKGLNESVAENLLQHLQKHSDKCVVVRTNFWGVSIAFIKLSITWPAAIVWIIFYWAFKMIFDQDVESYFFWGGALFGLVFQRNQRSSSTAFHSCTN